MMIDIAHSREREDRFAFSAENVFLNWGSVYTKKGFTAESVLDLKGKKVAAVREDIHTVGENGIETLAEQFDLQLNLVLVDSYQEVLEAVDEGRGDAGVVNRLFGAIAEKKYSITKSPIVFNPDHLRFVFPKTSEDKHLLEVIGRHVNALKGDLKSVFHRIVNSYLSGSEYDFDSYDDIRSIRFSENELAWLREHPRFALGWILPMPLTASLAMTANTRAWQSISWILLPAILA